MNTRSQKEVTSVEKHLRHSGLCSDAAINQALDEQKELAAQGRFLSLGQILVKNQFISQPELDGILKCIELQAMAEVELFHDLPPSELSQLYHKSEVLHLSDQASLFQEGDRADAYYIIVSGVVRVFRHSQEGLEIDLNTLRAGDGFGEMGILYHGIRTAHASCIGPVHLLKISNKDFQEFLCAHHEASAKLLKTLSLWLFQNEQALTLSRSREKKYSQLLTQSAVNSYETILESEKLFRRIKDRIDVLAASDLPCFVCGEQGTEVIGVALLIHERSSRQQGPFLRFQARDAGEIAGQSSEGNRHSAEAQQLYALLGSKAEFSPPSLGLVSAADQGTLVIEDMESLAMSVQARLADFLQTGRFFLPHSQDEYTCSVKVIGTCRQDPKTLVQLGLLDKRLVESFDPTELEIPPLRKRKRDLKLIADQLIRIGNRRTGKCVQGIEQDAYQRIMAYDWPGNFEELETTIVRAVTLCSGDTLTSQDLFFGLKPIQGKWTINLFQCKPLKHFMQSPLYPGLFQAVLGVLFVAVLFLAFGASEFGRRLALDLTWGVWEPLAVLGAFFLGRFWCAVCPIRGAGMFISKKLSLKLEVTDIIRRLGPYISAAGIVLIIWAEVTWDLFSSAPGTAVLLLIFAGLGVLSSLIFKNLVWCRYLCPLGALLGLLARCSCTELRSNPSVCTNDCFDHPCIERQNTKGCPMLEAPFTITSNQNCVLCAQCIKVCPLDSPAFNLRIPGYELGTVRYPAMVMNILVPVLMGTQLFRGMIGLNGLLSSGSMELNAFISLFGLGICTFAALGLISLTANQMLGLLLKSDLKKRWLMNYSLLPLLFAYETGYHLGKLLTKGGWVIPELGGMWGVTWEAPTFAFSPGAVIALQTIIMLGGCIWSAMLVNSIAVRHQASGQKMNTVQRWPVLFLAALMLSLLVMP